MTTDPNDPNHRKLPWERTNETPREREEREDRERLDWHYRPYGPNCSQCGMSPCGCSGI